MKKTEQRPLWQVLCIFAAIFLVLSMLLGVVFQFYITPKAEEDKLGYPSVFCKNADSRYLPTDGKFTLRQSFTAKDAMSGYAIFVGFTEEKQAERATQSKNGEWVEMEGELRIRFLDSNENVLDDYVLTSEEVNAAWYFGRIMRSFDALIAGSVRGQTYTLEMIGDFPRDAGIYIAMSDFDYYAEGDLTINGVPTDADINFFTVSPIYTMARLLFLAFSAGILGAFTLIYFCAYIFRAKKHILFFVTVLIMGIAYTALITPFAAPDETVHFFTAYRFANVITGVEETETPDETVYVRACDTDYNGRLSQYYGKLFVPTVSTYTREINSLLGAAENDEPLEIQSDFVSGNYVCYFPAGIGIALGKTLHLSSALTFYLARFMNLLLFALLGACAVKKIPFGKNIFFVSALLPLTLQQVASVSYDSILISVGFYYLALCVHLAYSAEKFRVWELVQLVLCLTVFCAPKAGVYIVLLAVLPIVLFNQKLSKKQRIGFLCGSTVCAALLLALFNFWRLSDAGSAPAAVETYTLGYIFANPLDFVKLWVNTYFQEKETWFYSLFGSNMAWVNLKVEKSWAVLFVTLLVLGSIRSDDDPVKARVTDKIFYGAAALLCIAGFCAAAFLWTPSNSDYVAGLQTRYILPVLPMLLLLVRMPSISCRKDMTGFLTVTAVLANALYIIDALNVTLFI